MSIRKIKHCLFVVVGLLFALGSCKPTKDIIYFQPKQDSVKASRIEWKNFPNADTSNLKAYQPIIRPNDILNIYVSSINKEANAFFNTVETKDASNNSSEILGYLVDAKGEIEMPLLGSVKVAGMTIPVIKDTLKLKLEKYLQSPTVRVVLENFKVTIIGEVTRPGIYSIKNERLTIPEAIGMAGDLTIYGKRTNILLIREENSKKEFATIDITQRDVFKSPYYYLHPNDVLYVEPVKAKIANADNFYRITPIIISALTLVAVIVVKF